MSKQNTVYLSSALLILLFSALFTIPSEPPFGFRINKTNSLPYRLFFRQKSRSSVKHGDIVCFRHPYSADPVAKEVMGLPGENIRISDHQVFIEDKNLGQVQSKSPSGLALHPIPEGVIEAGHCFVHGRHELSFDSRYAEFGLINLENIEDILCPLF